MKTKNIKPLSCLLCDQPLTTIFDTQIKVNHTCVYYHVCNHCGFTWKDPQFYVPLEEEKRQYDYHQNSLENEGYVKMFETFIDVAISPFIQAGSALDYGAGPGPVLPYLLTQKGFETTLYDPFYAPYAKCLNTQYDLVTVTEVFEHFYDPLASIKRVVDCVKPQGILAIMTRFKTMDNPTFLTWWYRRDVTHVCFYTEKAFQFIAKRFNLTQLYTNHTNIIVFRKEAKS